MPAKSTTVVKIKLTNGQYNHINYVCPSACWEEGAWD